MRRDKKGRREFGVMTGYIALGHAGCWFLIGCRGTSSCFKTIISFVDGVVIPVCTSNLIAGIVV